MAVTWLTAFLDTEPAHAAETEAYWSAVTGWPVSERRGPQGEFATLVPPDGDSPLKVQVVGAAPPGGMHLDVHTDDLDCAVEDARRYGATVEEHPLGYAVGRSPGGATFCLVEHAASRRPGPVSWPGGASAVDQVCLDIPEEDFDREATFWRRLLERSQSRGSLPEFDRLQRPDDQALQVLLQRVGGGGPVRMHLDLSCDDRDAEVARHVALGGRVVRRTERWTTLLDPCGREYCVTRRPTGVTARG